MGLLHLCRFQLFTCEQVAKSAYLIINDDTQTDGLVVEVLNHQCLIIIGEQRHLRRSFDIRSDVLAHGTTDDVQCPCWIVVEVAVVIGDGEHEERTL